MTDTQTSLPSLIVQLFILNPVMHFSTQAMTGEMKCPTSHTFACAFHFIFSNVDATSTNLHQAFDHHHESIFILTFLE